MTLATKTKTLQIIKVMKVVTWVAFIGLLIAGGAILFVYLLSISNGQASANFYGGENLQALREASFLGYTGLVLFMASIPITKAHVAFRIIQSLNYVKLDNPFTEAVTQSIEKISYVLIGLWILVVINNTYAEWLLQNHQVSQVKEDSGAYLFMAGLVFIISQIFKRGVEIQQENELTV